MHNSNVSKRDTVTSLFSTGVPSGKLNTFNDGNPPGEVELHALNELPGVLNEPVNHEQQIEAEKYCYCFNNRKHFVISTLRIAVIILLLIIFIVLTTTLTRKNCNSNETDTGTELIEKTNEYIGIMTDTGTELMSEYIEGLHVNKDNITSFLENIKEYIMDNEVIVFEEDVELLSISNELTIEKDIEMISISGTKLRINCPEFGKILFNIKGGAVVKLSGFKMSGCTNLDNSLIKIQEKSSLNLENMSFTDFKVDADDEKSLIESYSSKIYMNNLYFVNNKFDNNIHCGFHFHETVAEIKNSEFSSNRLIEYYSSIFLIEQNSEIHMENIIFSDNISEDRAESAIEAWDSDIKMENVIARDNRVERGSGGFAGFMRCTITIKNFICHANEVEGIGGVGGGCLWLYDNNAEFDNVTMSENQFKSEGEDGGGGAIYMQYGTLEIVNSEFSDNFAWEGGAIFIDEDASFNIKKSVFKSNIATYGSCFGLSDNSTFYAEETEFIDNIAEYGSIGYIKGYSVNRVTLEDCTLTNNIGDEEIYEDYEGYNVISIND